MFRISNPNITVLVELSTRGVAKLFAFPPNEERALTVGSDPRAQLRVVGQGVAPVQFHLERRVGTLCLIPAYGLDDLRVNTARVSGPLPLEERNVIEFGDIRVDATILDGGVRASLPGSNDTWSDNPARISEPPGDCDTTQIAMRAITSPAAAIAQQTTAVLRPTDPQVTGPQETERMAPYRSQTPPAPATQPALVQSTERMAPVRTTASIGRASPTFTTLGTEIMAPVHSAADDPDSPPPTLRGGRPPPVTVAPVSRAPLKTLSFHPLNLDRSPTPPRASPFNGSAAAPPLPTVPIVPVPVVAVSTPASATTETFRAAADRTAESSTTLFEVPPIPPKQPSANVPRHEATPTAVDVCSPLLERQPDETPNGVVKTRPIAATALSWLAKLGQLAKARPVLVACGALAGSFVLAAALLVSTRLIERRELRAPAAVKLPAAGSSALSRPVVDVQAVPSMPVQIVDAPASANGATRSPTAKKIPNDPELAAAVAHVIAGRYGEARAAYALLSQRTASAATYTALSRLFARAENPACVANSKDAPKDCPGVQR